MDRALQKGEQRMNNDIYKMNLHERIQLEDGVYVLRVTGGWIYEHGNYDYSKDTFNISSTVFVPFDSTLNVNVKIEE